MSGPFDVKHELVVTADDGATWSAGHVVVASGSWSGQLELLDPAARAMRPVRGQLIQLWTGRRCRT